MPRRPSDSSRRRFVLLLLLAFAAACAGPRRDDAPPRAAGAPEDAAELLPPTLVLIGKVRTMDPRVPEAEAVVVRGERVVRATTAADALASVRASTQVVRLPPGAIVLPGLIESHAHLRGVGRAAREIDLSATRSIADAVAKVAAAAAADGGAGWIVGGGWNQERWAEKRWPTADELAPATGARPAALVRADGHAVWVNAAALKLAGVDASTPNPPGGEILRNADGSPTGVLIDAAMEPVLARAEGRLNAELMERDFLRGEEEAFRHGVTTFVDAGDSYIALLTLLKLYDAGRMRLRTYGMAGVSTAAELVEALSRPIVVDHRDRFTVRALKLYADGALGSRGARLLAPYADRPEASGLELATPDFLRKTADRCLERGWQLCVHAIGDGAVRGVLDAIEGATSARPGVDHRFRVEHAQHVDPRDVRRFVALGVVPSMQPCHATSDFPWAADRLGRERLERTGYRWRDFLDAGAYIPAGTDAPVEPLSPFANFYAAVTRRDPQRRTTEAFTPDQRFNRYEALQALTIYGARATFAEHRRGMIAPGYDADLCVVSHDLLTVADEELLAARCLRTIVAGETVYAAP